MSEIKNQAKFDVLAAQANEILQLKRDLKKKKKKTNYSRSKLRKFFPEARRLKEEFGFSFPDISMWLREKKRVVMSPDGVRSAYRRIESEMAELAELKGK